MKKISEKKLEKVDSIKQALGKDYSNYVQNAVEEILYRVYAVAETNEQYDKIIDDIGIYIKNKLNIENDDNIEWQNIEEWYSEWCNSLLYYLDEKEVVKILGSIKIKEKHKWEEPYGKIDIETLQKKIYESIIENIEHRTIEELEKEFKC